MICISLNKWLRMIVCVVLHNELGNGLRLVFCLFSHFLIVGL